MKKLIIKLFDKVILFLLGFSGIVYTACKYGMAVPINEINGVVTDKATAKPISNIRVIRANAYDNDTSYTNSEGKYAFKFWREGLAHLKIEDIDGEENGGDFQTQEIDVKFTDADLVKRGRNNKTPDRYAKKINIELEKKEMAYPEYGVPPTNFKP